MSALFDQVDRFPLWLSPRLALIATVVSLTFGLAFAPLRRRLRGRGLLEALVTLPMVLPQTVLGCYRFVAAGWRGPLGEDCERECPAGARRFRGGHASRRRRRGRRCDRVSHSGGRRARGARCDCLRRSRCRAKRASDLRVRFRLTFLGLSMIRHGEASSGKSGSRRTRCGFSRLRSERQVDRLT